MASFRLYVRVQVHDGRKKVYDSGQRASRSYLANFVKHIWLAFENTALPGAQEPVDVGGSARDAKHPGAGANKFMRNTTLSGAGILVGTGITAVDIDDSSLAAEIADGVAAGELSRGANTNGAVATSDTQSSFDITRSFANSSGGDVVVAETGMAGTTNTTTTGDEEFLLIRDVLSATVTVANGETLTVTYTIKAVP